MSGQLIYRPMVNDHFCNPGWELVDGQHFRELEVPPLGTIWRCECGVLWEAVRQPYVNVFPKREWARAGWRTRWRYR